MRARGEGRGARGGGAHLEHGVAQQRGEQRGEALGHRHRARLRERLAHLGLGRAVHLGRAVLGLQLGERRLHLRLLGARHRRADARERVRGQLAQVHLLVRRRLGGRRVDGREARPQAARVHDVVAQQREVHAHLRAALLPRVRLLLRRLLRRVKQRLRIAPVAAALGVAPAREAAEHVGGRVAQLGLIAAEQAARRRLERGEHGLAHRLGHGAQHAADGAEQRVLHARLGAQQLVVQVVEQRLDARRERGEAHERGGGAHAHELGAVLQALDARRLQLRDEGLEQRLPLADEQRQRAEDGRLQGERGEGYRGIGV